jgi:tetratricopeptide (TPR) repeat protein
VATIGRTTGAINSFERAIQVKADFTEAHANLAACYADANRLTDALATAKIALSLAESQRRSDLVEKITKWIEEHQAKSN